MKNIDYQFENVREIREEKFENIIRLGLAKMKTKFGRRKWHVFNVHGIEKQKTWHRKGEGTPSQKH